jgi:hypothetical protein
MSVSASTASFEQSNFVLDRLPKTLSLERMGEVVEDLKTAIDEESELLLEEISDLQTALIDGTR